MSKKKAVFKVSIDDSFCEWTFDLELSEDLSIDDIALELCEAFKIDVPKPVLRRGIEE